MKKYHRDILRICENGINETTVIWSGKPQFLAYMFANKELLGETIGAICIFAYEKFQIGFFSKACIVIFAINLIYAVISWAKLTYCITSNGPVVKRGSKYYMIDWRDIRLDEYKIRRHPMEYLLGCKTFEFSRSYMTSKNDSWREKARFWGIKDHENVEQIIRRYISM